MPRTPTIAPANNPAKGPALPAQAILFHDGCNVCLSIEAAFLALFSNGLSAFESVNLGLDTARSAEAVRLGGTRLPSLVVGGKVMKVDDHSPIEHYLGTAQPDRA